MKENNLIAEKSFDFAKEAVDLYKILRYKRKEFVMSTQFLRSSTSIVANVEEAIGAQSKRDFLHKLSISYKEARETKIWIKLLKHGDFVLPSEADKLIEEADEICRILGKIISTLKKKL